MTFQTYILIALSFAPLLLAVIFIRRYRYFSGFSFFLLWYFLTYCFRGVGLLFGWGPMTRQELVTGDQIEMVSTAMLLGMIAYFMAIIGYASLSADKTLKPIPWLKKQNFHLGWCNFIVSTVLFINLCLIGYLYFTFGGVFELIHAVRYVDYFKGKYLLAAIPEWSIFIGFFVYFMGMQQYNGKKIKFAGIVLIIVTALILLMLGQRAELFLPFITFLLASYGLKAKKIKLHIVRLVTIVLVLVTASSFLGWSRGLLSNVASREIGLGSFYEQIKDKQESTPRLFHRVSKGVNLNTLDHFAILTQDFSFIGGELGGLHFWRGVQGLVPRALWAGKPEAINTGAWFSQRYYGSVLHGMPFGVVGEWWLNFNLIGMSLGFIFTGLLFRILDNSLFAQNCPPVHRFLYAFFMIQIIPKGICSVIIVQIVKLMLPLVFIMLLLGSNVSFKSFYQIFFGAHTAVRVKA